MGFHAACGTFGNVFKSIIKEGEDNTEMVWWLDIYKLMFNFFARKDRLQGRVGIKRLLAPHLKLIMKLKPFHGQRELRSQKS